MLNGVSYYCFWPFTVFLTLDKPPLQKWLKGPLVVLMDHKVMSSCQCDSVLVEFCMTPTLLCPSFCGQSWNMVNHVCINVNHSIIWWLAIWKPCHHHDITMEYHSIVRLNETSCRSWYTIILIEYMIFSVTIPRCCKDVYVYNFFPCTTRLWNSLPIVCFPLTYDLSCFKSRINRHLLTKSKAKTDIQQNIFTTIS